METYTDDEGDERHDECGKLVDDCDCTCANCGDPVVECACASPS